MIDTVENYLTLEGTFKKNLLYLKWITNKVLLYSTGNSAQCYATAWMGGKFKGECICVLCMAESLCYSPETITTMLTGYNPIQNKKLKEKTKPTKTKQKYQSIFLICYFIGSSRWMGFPDSSVGKESICNAGDLGLIPGLGRSPGEGNDYPLQYSGLENSTDCIVHGVAKCWTQLNDFTSLHLSLLSWLNK